MRRSKTPPLANLLAATLACAILIAPIVHAASPQAPYAAAPYKAAPYKAAPYHPPVNRHLHGTATEHGRVVHVHGRWHHRWNSYAWFALHRGTGTIQGVVHNGSGVPIDGIRVGLRTASGHVLRHASSKHLTTTGSGGMFMMTHVRAGRYRVRAAQGKHSGHAPIVVHAGTMADVAVKL